MNYRNIVRRSALGSAVVSTVGALVAGLLPAGDLRAGIAFKDGVSTVTITHDRDITLADALFRRSPAPVPRSSQMYPLVPYQLSRTVGPDENTFSQAFASLGHITNPSTASFSLATGTGVTQTDSDEDFPGESSLKFNVDLRWNVLSGGFGPIATGFGSISAGGVVGSEGSTAVLIDLAFTDGNGVPLRSNWVVNDVLTTPGAFAKTYTTTGVLGVGTLAANSELRVQGTIEFRASNAGTPSHITPLNAEVGGTPPTGTFYATNGIWHDPGNWASPFPTQHQGEPQIVVANAAGQRARFLEAPGSRNITLTDNVTLGTLQIDSDQNHTFQDDGQGIQFVATGEDNAVIEIRDSFFFNAERQVGPSREPSSPTHTFNVDMDLVSSLDLLQNLRFSQVNLNGQITGIGGLTKLGRGTTTLTNGGNLYTGGTLVLEGILQANATGTLGTSDALVGDFGQLDYNAKNAVAGDGSVIVQRNGTLNLGIVPDASENLEVRAFGAIRGSSEELRALHTDSNLRLAENAMIVHEGTGGASPGGLGDSPKYFYGIAGDFLGVVPPVGSAASGPWKGFGAGNGEATLGTPGGGSLLSLAGDSIIAVLGNGRLNVNTPINGSSSSVLTKAGLGTLLINGQENGFAGQLRADEGFVGVNGIFKGGVEVGEGAGVGGDGVIEGKVVVLDGGILAPGDPQNEDGPNPGVLRLGSLFLNNESILNFEFAKTNDRVDVLGDLVLDGILNVNDSQLFGLGEHPLFTFGGEFTDNGLVFGFAPAIFSYKLEPRQVGNTKALFLIVSEVPEPGAAALVVGGMLGVALRRRRR